MRIIAIICFALASTAAWADVICDQIGPNPDATNGQFLDAAQEFEAIYSQYDIGVIDDFTVPSGGRTLQSVEAVIGFWAALAPQPNFSDVTGYRLEIYSSVDAAAANLTGDVASLSEPNYTNLVQPWGSGQFNQGKVLFDVSAANIRLATGTYWLAVIPQLVYGDHSHQSGISRSTLAAMTPLTATQCNPGGGFQFPNNWQLCNVTANPPGANAAYRLTAGGPVICRGDANCDGQVNFEDINPFVLALTNLAAWQAEYPDCPVGNVDINGDGQIDFADINPMVGVITCCAGPCQ